MAVRTLRNTAVAAVIIATVLTSMASARQRLELVGGPFPGADDYPIRVRHSRMLCFVGALAIGVGVAVAIAVVVGKHL